jgi:hypothetical protein
MVDTEFQLESEYGDGEAAELELLQSGPSLHRMASRCPPDRADTVRGFRQYSNAISLLPPVQRGKLAVMARHIVVSQTGPAPIVAVMITGHADMDPARESQEPGFMLRMSRLRADAAAVDLRRGVGPAVAVRIRWLVAGRGAAALAVHRPQTEAERLCNRRITIEVRRRIRGDRHVCGVPTFPAHSLEAPEQETPSTVRRRASPAPRASVVRARLCLFQNSAPTAHRNHFQCGAGRWASHVAAFMNPTTPSCPQRVGPTPYDTGRDIVRAIDEAFQCLGRQPLQEVHIFSHSAHHGVFGPSGQVGGMYKSEAEGPDRPNGGRTVTDIPANQLSDNVLFVFHGCNTANIDAERGVNLCKALFDHLRTTLKHPRVFGHYDTGCAGRDNNWREYSTTSPTGKKTRRSLSPLYTELPDARGRRCCGP